MEAMTTLPTRFIGCDVGKKEIVVYDSVSQAISTIANTAAALVTFAAGIEGDVLVICEATGGYEAALLNALVAAGRPVHRADARKVKAFIRSFGTLGKTDTLDARALAKYGEERHHHLPRCKPTSKSREKLSSLVLLRQAMVRDHTAWSNRCQAPTALIGFTDPIRQALAQQIAALEADIQALIDNCQEIARDIATLRTIKGIGPVTAPSLFALMPELGTLIGKKAASLAGLAPHPNQSGTRNGYRPVKGGRPEIKRLLFMAAMTARKYDPKLKTFYERLIANGKKPIVALTAVMRKIIVIANARLRDSYQQQVS